MYTCIYVYVYVYVYVHGALTISSPIIFSENHTTCSKQQLETHPSGNIVCILVQKEQQQRQLFSEIIVGEIVVRSPSVKIHQRGVQWKQGVVIYRICYTSLLYDTIPIRCTPLPLHPPVMNTQGLREAAAESHRYRCIYICTYIHIYINN